MSVAIDPATVADPGPALATLAERMADAHRRRFGAPLDRPVELMAARAVASGPAPARAKASTERGGTDARAALIDRVQCHFDGGFRETSVYDREKLSSGNRIAGPALVREPGTRTVIPPGWVGTVDEHLNILIVAGGSAGKGSGQ